IKALCARGFWFQSVLDEDTEIVVLVGSRGWPGCYDRLHVWGEDEAIAARAVPGERHGADQVVWTYQDAAVPTIQALLELPDPDDPAAPRLARDAPSDLWLPPSASRG